MNKTLIILKHEFSKTLKRKSFIIMTLAFPLLALLAIFGYQAIQGLWQPSAPSEITTVGYVDQAGGFDNYTSQPNVTLVPQVNEDKATEALLSEEISQYFVIPYDYLTSGVVTRYTLERELEPPDAVWQAIKNFLISNLLEEESDSQVVERVKYPLALNSITLDESGQVAPEQGGFSAFIVPYIFVYNNALLMIGNLWQIIWVSFTALLGVFALATAAQNFMGKKLAFFPRVALFGASLSLIVPGYKTDLLGLALLFSIFLYQRPQLGMSIKRYLARG